MEEAEGVMERVIRDGKVAVLFSPGFGSGWYTAHYIEELLFDPSIVQWVEAGELDKIKNYMTLKYPNEYLSGLSTLTIKWIPQGTEFRISEYDGAESIKCKSKEHWITA
jgi:hypothetical protein